MNIEIFKTEYAKFLNSDKNQFLLLYSSFEDKIVFLSKICKESNGQTLIICSSISKIFETRNILKKYIKQEEIEIIHKGYLKNETINKYKKINSEKIKVILGTKTSLFSPFFNLKNIVIIDEEDKDHKQQDQNPRYNIKDIAFYISEKNKIKLILTTKSPSIETFYKKLNILNLEEKNQETSINLVDLKTEKRSKNEFYISLKLQEKITESLENNSITIIINNDLKSEFKSNSKIKQELEEIFQENEKINQNKDLILTIDSKNKINLELLSKAKIIIGTEFFIKNYLYKIKNIENIAILSIDNIINFANIKTNENIFSYITNFIKLSKEKNIKNLIIQTKNIDNEILDLAINQDYKTFYNKEIKIREDLELPPFYKIINLITKNENKEKILEILDKNNIEIIGESLIEKELKTKIKKQEIVSIKIKNIDQNKEILKELSEQCLIDIN